MFRKIMERIREPFSSSAVEGPDKGKITIGITTFEARFSSFFVPLVERIKDFEPESEIVVAVNGEHELAFGENYREEILRFTARMNNVFPILFPRFRGLSKLWNTIIVHATNDYILMLNDDLTLTNRNFLDDVAAGLCRSKGRSFLINDSWSHFLVGRNEIDELGYFDERLLGIGEEDGDMTWRYLERYGKRLASCKIKGIVNHAGESLTAYQPKNITGRNGTKYSLFNREFMFTRKYEFADSGIQGMFDKPAVLKDPCEGQYPYEGFYRANKKSL